MPLLSVPLKTILPYYATVQFEPLPSEWAYCDGRQLAAGTHDIDGGGLPYRLPDMRNRFLLGADISKSPGLFAAPVYGGGIVDGNINNGNGGPGIDYFGGSHILTLSETELPSHSHTISLATDGDHGHAVTPFAAVGDHQHNLNGGGYFVLTANAGSRGTGNSHIYIAAQDSVTGPAGAHTHAASIAAVANHQHGLGIGNARTAGATAGGGAFAIVPAFCSVVWIQKVKL